MNLVAVRIVTYVLSPLLAMAIAAIPGWGIAIDGNVVSIDLTTLAGAVVTGLGISAAVFARWGVK